MAKTTDSIVVTEIGKLWGWQRIHFKRAIKKGLGKRKPNSHYKQKNSSVMAKREEISESEL